MINRFKKLTKEEKINLSEKQVRGHVIIKDPSNGNIIVEKDNLVVMRTRVFLFEQLFKVNPPDYYNCQIDNDRSICLFKVGQGGADVNSASFSPFAPKFSDSDLAQPVPFITVNPDKDSDAELDANPSIVSELSDDQTKMYYLPTENPDGSVSYYGKVFESDSKGWVIDNNTGEVAYSLSMKINENECRGYILNEIGTVLATYDEDTNTYLNYELATRITFDSESLSSLTKGIEIEYIFYI